MTEVTVGRDYLEAQLKNERDLKLKVEGAINALEGMLKLIDQEEARGREAKVERCADQQPQEVAEPTNHPEGNQIPTEDVIECDAC